MDVGLQGEQVTGLHCNVFVSIDVCFYVLCLTFPPRTNLEISVFLVVSSVIFMCHLWVVVLLNSN